MNSNFIADLTDKTAIITGGAGLIGRVYASALLQSGSNVIILDKRINKIKLTELIKKENNGASINSENLKLIECDITNPQEIKRIFKKMKPYLSNLKILINNASLVKQVRNPSDLVSAYKPFLKMNPNDWEEYLSVDITGSLLTIQQVIPYMKKNNGGAIVNISSTYGILSPDQRLYAYFNKKLSKKEKKLGTTIEKPIGYSISKSGVLNMTRFLATKFADDNIRVNTLSRGRSRFPVSRQPYFPPTEPLWPSVVMRRSKPVLICLDYQAGRAMCGVDETCSGPFTRRQCKR